MTPAAERELRQRIRVLEKAVLEFTRIVDSMEVAQANQVRINYAVRRDLDKVASVNPVDVVMSGEVST